jgi:hypothetical protein
MSRLVIFQGAFGQRSQPAVFRVSFNLGVPGVGVKAREPIAKFPEFIRVETPNIQLNPFYSAH